MSDSPTRRSRLGAVAGLLGAATAFTFVLGAGPAPSVFQLAGANEDVSGNCDEAEHANDPECGGSPTTDGNGGSTSSTVDDSGTSTTIGGSTPTVADSGPSTAVRSIDAAGAGTVLVAVEGGSLRLVAATPTAGWRVEVEQGAGREVEVDFRSGTKRVQVNVELEDGQVRERVRVRDDADDTDIRSENGAVVRDDSDGRIDDTSGHSSDDSADDGSGHGSDDSADDDPDDDRSGSGHGDDDDGDDDSGSGHGSDDERRRRPRRQRRRLSRRSAPTPRRARPRGRAVARESVAGPLGARAPPCGASAREAVSSLGDEERPGRRSGWRGC